MAEDKFNPNTRSPRYSSRRALGFRGGSTSAGGNLQLPTFREVSGVSEPEAPVEAPPPPAISDFTAEMPDPPSPGEQVLVAGASSAASDLLKGAASGIGNAAVGAPTLLASPDPGIIIGASKLPSGLVTETLIEVPGTAGAAGLAPAGEAAVGGTAAAAEGAAAGGLSGALASGGAATIGALALPVIAGFTSGRRKKANIEQQNARVRSTLGEEGYQKLRSDMTAEHASASEKRQEADRAWEAANPGQEGGRAPGGQKQFYEPAGANAQYINLSQGRSATTPIPGCFITEAVAAVGGQGDSAPELQMLRWFRDNVMLRTPQGMAMVEEYYAIAPMVIESVVMRPDGMQILQGIKGQFIDPAVDAIKAGNFKAALEIYAQMIQYVQAFAAEGVMNEQAAGEMEGLGQHAAMVGQDDMMSAEVAPEGPGDADFTNMAEHEGAVMEQPQQFSMGGGRRF